MAAEESVKPVGAPASRTNSTAQMHVPVGKNVLTVTTVNSAMMRTTPVAKEKMTCKSYLMINRIAFVTYFLKVSSNLASMQIRYGERSRRCCGNMQCHCYCFVSQ